MKTIILLLLASPAFAQVTYVYTGAPLIASYAGDGPGPANITAQIVLSQPLATNEAGQVVTPVSFIILGTVSSDMNPGDHNSTAMDQFSFDTVNGVITGWHISAIWTVYNSNSASVTIDSTGGDVFYAEVWSDAQCAQGALANCDTVRATTPTPGVWTYGADLVAKLQKQITHMNSVATFYENGVVNWEAQALAWQATAWKCQKNKGVC